MNIAAKSYMDGQGRMVNAGDTMPEYDAATMAHYKRLGIVSEAAATPAKPAKPTKIARSAKPTETKAEPAAQTADEAPAPETPAAE